jgi:demethylspheroidene O-methyltransferase
VLKANPSLKGGFIDVPACIEVGKEGIAADQLSDRMDAIAGNIFTDAFPKADLITLCRSAMDWGDEVIGRLYGKIRETLPLGGRVLIIERMLPEEMDARGKALFLRSVYFLAKSTTTRYRRPSEHAKLLKDAGFTDVEVREPPKAPYEFFQSMRMVVAAKTA